MIGDTKTHPFHVNATAVADGKFFDNDAGFKYITVDIDGSPDSFNLNFEYVAANGVRKALKGTNKVWTSGTSTTTSSDTWDFDISGKKRVYMDLTAITPGAGSLTVKGIAGY
jgi:hypothetical protein